MVRAIGLVVVFLICSIGARAHPFHASIAEAEWKPGLKKLQIALWSHPTDLEKALRLRAKKRIDLDSTPDVDQHIQGYLREVFRVGYREQKPGAIEWVGKEVSVKAAWLYFEISLPAGIEGALIENRLFFELLSDQVNTINFRDRKAKRKRSFSFTKEKPKQRFSWEAKQGR